MFTIRNNIIIVGYPGSGKTTAARYLSQRLNLPVYEIGRVVVEECIRLNYPGTPLEYADSVFTSGNYNHFMDIIIRNMIKDHSFGSIIVGPRCLQEVSQYLTFLSPYTYIGIVTHPLIRHDRVSHNQEKQSDNNSPLETRDRIESSWGLDIFLEKCTNILYNSGSISSFYTQIDTLTKSLRAT